MAALGHRQTGRASPPKRTVREEASWLFLDLHTASRAAQRATLDPPSGSQRKLRAHRGWLFDTHLPRQALSHALLRMRVERAKDETGTTKRRARIWQTSVAREYLPTGEVNQRSILHRHSIGRTTPALPTRRRKRRLVLLPLRMRRKTHSCLSCRLGCVGQGSFRLDLRRMIHHEGLQGFSPTLALRRGFFM